MILRSSAAPNVYVEGARVSHHLTTLSYVCTLNTTFFDVLLLLFLRHTENNTTPGVKILKKAFKEVDQVLSTPH